MARFFDRECREVTVDEWCDLTEDASYRRVADTTRNGVRVSTIWFGIDNGVSPGVPLLFETLVVDAGGVADRFRWSTLSAARAGHVSVVERFGGVT